MGGCKKKSICPFGDASSETIKKTRVDKTELALNTAELGAAEA